MSLQFNVTSCNPSLLKLSKIPTLLHYFFSSSPLPWLQFFEYNEVSICALIHFPSFFVLSDVAARIFLTSNQLLLCLCNRFLTISFTFKNSPEKYFFLLFWMSRSQHHSLQNSRHKTLQTVSYTHLDVYKRQGSSERPWPIYTTPVSYTHLDVYKRQLLYSAFLI